MMIKNMTIAEATATINNLTDQVTFLKRKINAQKSVISRFKNQINSNNS